MNREKLGTISSINYRDYIYVLISCLAGFWQAWVANYPKDDVLEVILTIAMSLPFAVASHIYASTDNSNELHSPLPWWKILVFWAGMPLSIMVMAATILAETGIMPLLGFSMENLPFYNIRILIGECAASFAWAGCFLLWSRETKFKISKHRFIAITIVLFLGASISYGIGDLTFRRFHKDIVFALTSVVVTVISALIVVFLMKNVAVPKGLLLPVETMPSSDTIN